MHFLSIHNDNVCRTSNRDSFGYQSGHKTGCSGPVIYAGGNSRLLHFPQSDDEPQSLLKIILMRWMTMKVTVVVLFKHGRQDHEEVE